jgi:hypothetical protein
MVPSWPKMCKSCSSFHMVVCSLCLRISVMLGEMTRTFAFIAPMRHDLHTCWLNITLPDLPTAIIPHGSNVYNEELFCVSRDGFQ